MQTAGRQLKGIRFELYRLLLAHFRSTMSASGSETPPTGRPLNGIADAAYGLRLGGAASTVARASRRAPSQRTRIRKVAPRCRSRGSDSPTPRQPAGGRAMQRRDRAKLGSIIAAIILCAVATGVALGAFGLYLSDLSNRQHRAWRDFAREENLISNSVEALHFHLGYGGFIHNFKNFVLRGTAEYADRTQEHIAAARLELNHLRDALQNPELRAAIADIRAAVDGYEERLRLVLTERASMTAEQVDRNVRYDDTAAVRALGLLSTASTARIQEQFEAADELSRQINRLLGFGLLIFVLVAAVGTALVIMVIRLATLSRRLRNANEEVTLLLKSAPDAVLHADGDGRIISANDRATEMLGYSPDEFRGMSVGTLVPVVDDVVDFLYPEDPEAALSPGSSLALQDLVATTRDGAEIPVSVNLNSILRDGERMAIVAIRDATAERGRLLRLTAALAQRVEELSSEKLKTTAILDTVVEGIVTIDEAGQIDSLNHAAERIFGWRADEVIGRNIKVLMPSPYQEDHDGYLQAYRSTGEAKIIGIGREVEGLRKDGSVFPMELAIGHTELPDRRMFTGVIRDRTEHHRQAAREAELRDQLQQSAKLSTVGTLAGGIAHDFNNILTPILGYCDLLLGTLPEGSAEAQDVRVIERSARRARDVVAQLLAFARPTDAGRTPVSVGGAIAEAVALVQPIIPPNVRLTVTDVDGDPIVDANASRLQQVLVNLLGNALDALAAGGGEISVRCETTSDLPGEAPSGDRRYACILVEDNGPGMPPEIAGRVFEPFFTTKPIGSGTGLGLSVAYGIVTGWGGRLTVRSRPGAGSVFAVYLPLSDTDVPAAQPSPLMTGSGRVLVVDDDPDVLSVTGRMLERLGYRSTLVGSVDDALTLIGEGTEDFDIILTDHTIAGRPVSDLVAAAERLWPGIATLVMSGFDLRVDNGLAVGGGRFLRKPLTLSELSTALARARGIHTDTN
ncbi:PAS domain S-box protein [Thalassobaculum sp.]|uniref:hybrid sensor histidine kinase/response regulator n=1 Tax=Thalassobaculum sp. TaxID=2022740 RepID=UPI0032ECA29F